MASMNRDTQTIEKKQMKLLLKNTTSTPTDTLGGIMNRLNMAETNTIELENITVAITQRKV